VKNGIRSAHNVWAENAPKNTLSANLSIMPTIIRQKLSANLVESLEILNL